MTVRGPTGQVRRIRAIIDSGFDGSLSLPAVLIAELGLHWWRVGCALLADGTECTFNVYRAKVVWDRRSRDINVDEAETMPLLGTALLEDFELNAQFRRRGKVTIRPLPARRRR